MEAFNSLPENQKRRVKDNINEDSDIKEEHKPVLAEKISSDQPALPPPVQKPADVHAIKRIVPLKKSLAERKSNPKTVTASVFKTISPDVKLLKTIPPTRHMNGTDAQKLRSVTSNHLKTASSARSEGITGDPQQLQTGGENRTPQIVNQPSISVAQKVVTASLIHPRKDVSLQKTTAAAAVTVAAATPQNMNKTFFMFSDSAPQLCREYSGCVVWA